MNQINPQLVYVLHQEKIQNLERQAEFARHAKVMRAYETSASQGQSRSWFAQAGQWVKAQFAPQSQAAASSQKAVEEPC